jgi:hypothetical protein
LLVPDFIDQAVTGAPELDLVAVDASGETRGGDMRLFQPLGQLLLLLLLDRGVEPMPFLECGFKKGKLIGHRARL